MNFFWVLSATAFKWKLIPIQNSDQNFDLVSSKWLRYKTYISSYIFANVNQDIDKSKSLEAKYLLIIYATRLFFLSIQH